jgi:hypothetical protein
MSLQAPVSAMAAPMMAREAERRIVVTDIHRAES